jgi:acylphosphatase
MRNQARGHDLESVENKRLELRIRGVVQGVAFRYHTRDEASRLGLTGWVRNLADGSVQVLAEGPRPALEELCAWCSHGPPAAEVDHVEQRWERATGELRRFFIDH